MKNIFLIGMPSSGKTSLGKQLARHFEYLFVDLDGLIVAKERMTIAHIFEQKGEDYFRQVESKTLKEMKPNSNMVIATGGGTPYFFDNMQYIKTNGYSLFLDVSPSELLQRMQQSLNNERPLYNTEEEAAALLQTLEQKHQERRPYYLQANAIVQSDQITLEDILKAINPKELR